MPNIIKYEIKKMISSKITYICLLLTMLLSAVVSYGFLGMNADNTLVGVFVSAIPSAGYDLVLAIMISIFICEDYSVGVIKMIIGRGYERKEIYFAKCLMVSLYTVILSLACVLTGLIVGYMLPFNNKALSAKAISIVLVQFLVMLVITTMMVMLAVIIQKKSIAIAVNILAPSIIQLIWEIADEYIKGLKFSHYWVAMFMNELTNDKIASDRIMEIMVCSVIYIFLFIVIGYMALCKKDLR